jgi:hypothetical protein
MIPLSGRGDSGVILFIMSIHRDYLQKMSEISKSNEELSKHAQYLEQDVSTDISCILMLIQYICMYSVCMYVYMDIHSYAYVYIHIYLCIGNVYIYIYVHIGVTNEGTDQFIA